jgi:hypothetical protein
MQVAPLWQGAEAQKLTSVWRGAASARVAVGLAGAGGAVEAGRGLAVVEGLNWVSRQVEAGVQGAEAQKLILMSQREPVKRGGLLLTS